MAHTLTTELALVKPTAGTHEPVSLTDLNANLDTLDALFNITTGHDHSGAHKGKPITTAAIASGVVLTSPHFVSPVVDSGGLTVTAGGITISAGALTLSGGFTIPSGGLTIGAGGITVTGNSTITGTLSGVTTLTATTVTATTHNGTIGTAAQPNITSVGTLTSLAVTGTITAGGVTVSGGTVSGLALLAGTGGALLLGGTVIAGADNTSSTFAIQVTNLIGTVLMQCRDDGTLNQTKVAWTLTSTEEFKDDIRALDNGLDIVRSLRPKHYVRTDIQLPHREFGLIAEEVHSVLPEVVGYDAAGAPVGIRFENLTAPIISAIQTLADRVDALEGRAA